MKIDEVCPDCGAERPSWHGGSHRHHNFVTREYDAPVCDDGRTPDDIWRHKDFTSMSRHLVTGSTL